MSADGKKEEDDCGCTTKWKTKTACPSCQHVTHPLRYYEFTQDEIKALEECDKESFYHRCLPFSTLFASITYAAIKYGFMKRNPHYGATPKVLLAVVMGHIVGRLSYLSECDEKLRQELGEKSYLGNVMRKYHMDAHPELYKKK